MDASKLYRTQLLVTKLFGFNLDYPDNWKGVLMRFYAFFTITSCFFTIGLMLHFIAFENYTIEEFSDAFGCIFAIMETLIKLIVIYKWRYKYKKLFRDIQTILSSGNSLSAERFEEIVRIGEKLTWMYLIPSTLTSEAYIFGAFYKMFVNSGRELPFKVR